MRPIFFTKLSTLGNNYLILNFLEELEFITDYSKLAKEMTNHQNGIFADGIIILTPSKLADLTMTIYNNDGSRAKTCGNGLRLIGRYLMDFDHFIKDVIRVETDANVATLTYEDEMITVDLGLAHSLTDPTTPLLLDNNDLHYSREIKTSFGPWTVDMISMGNPHYIIYTDESHHSFFNELEKISKEYDVNVGLMTIINNRKFKLTTYERGAGFTGACGTNTAAAVASAVLRRKLLPHQTLTATLPGGTLYVQWNDDCHLLATQKANKVCCGTYFFEEK